MDKKISLLMYKHYKRKYNRFVVKNNIVKSSTEYKNLIELTKALILQDGIEEVEKISNGKIILFNNEKFAIKNNGVIHKVKEEITGV